MSFKWKNWRKESDGILVLIALILANSSVFSDQLITLLKEAPFTVSDKVYEYIVWLLKALTFLMSLVTIFTKKKEKQIN